MSVSAYSQHRSTRGFTLVELLVAIAILGLLMTSAFGALSLGSKSWEQSVRRADDNEILRSSNDFLRRQFAQLLPLSWHDGERKVIAFEGDRSSMRFVAPAPDALQSSGLLLISLVVTGIPDETAVNFGIHTVDPGIEDWFENSATRQDAMLSDLGSASFAYFGALDEQQHASWHDQWPRDARFFPVAVRITTSAGENQHELPDFYFPIHAVLQQ